jgi:methylglutaconyl-CoA hydratase
MYSAAGGVATLTLDSPETRNALTPALLRELSAGLARAEQDPSVRVVVLTNTGSVFCAGADLKADKPGPAAVEGRAPALHEIFVQIQQATKPVVARIAGHCAAGGVGLAAACDLSVAAEDVWLGFTEVRIGVAPMVISAVVLPKLGRADAAEFFLTGERIPAPRAAEAGLINRSVPRDRLDAEVDALVASLLLGGPNALAAVKELLRVAPTLDAADPYSWVLRRSTELFASDEAQAGIAAFRARSTPPWAVQDETGQISE